MMSCCYNPYNARGDVVNLADASGNIVASFTYDEFGVLLSSSESFPGGWSNPYRYDGRDLVRYDSETSLYWMSVRAYDPTLGRFIARDPLGRAPLMGWTSQPYAYASNNPLVNVDPSGQRLVGDSGAVVSTPAQQRRAYSAYHRARATAGAATKKRTRAIGNLSRPIGAIGSARLDGGFCNQLTTSCVDVPILHGPYARHCGTGVTFCWQGNDNKGLFSNQLIGSAQFNNATNLSAVGETGLEQLLTFVFDGSGSVFSMVDSEYQSLINRANDAAQNAAIFTGIAAILCGVCAVLPAAIGLGDGGDAKFILQKDKDAFERGMAGLRNEVVTAISFLQRNPQYDYLEFNLSEVQLGPFGWRSDALTLWTWDL